MYALTQILVVFAGMLVLSRVGLPLGAALLLGGLTLDLWAGASLVALLSDLASALTRPELWLLLVIVTLIVEIGHYMAEQRNARALMSAAAQWGGRHGRALSLMAIPAAIGLVPMPGGALFSAPLVEQTVSEKRWTPDWKAAVNYWFRHVWEYWWPLYPVVFVSLPIFDMETWQFIATTCWFSVAAIASGYFFLIQPHLDGLAATPPAGDGSGRRAIFLLVPLLVVVAATLLLPFVLRDLTPGLGLAARKMLSMLLGLLLALVLIFRDRDVASGRRAFSGLWSAKTAQVLTTLGGVLVFQSLLDSSGLLPNAGQALVGSGIPVVVVVAALPLVAGLVTGIAVGFAGAAFPLVAGLMATEGSGLTPMATLALAFGFGYAGMMLSPVHLCLVLTRDYFEASYRAVYRNIFPCILVLLGFSVVLYVLMSAAGL